MARMFNPPHPGLTLRDEVLPALGCQDPLGYIRVLRTNQAFFCCQFLSA